MGSTKPWNLCLRSWIECSRNRGSEFASLPAYLIVNKLTGGKGEGGGGGGLEEAGS